MAALPISPATQGGDSPAPATPSTSQNDLEVTLFSERTQGALADVPAWAIAMRDNCNESINAVRDTLNNRIDNVRDDLVQRLDGLSHRMLAIQVIAARSYNASIPIAIPPHVVYEIVPFSNGDGPTLPPHSLPPLRTKVDLEGLSHAQVRQYLRGYNLVAGVNVAAETDRRSLARYLRITW